MSLFLRPAPKPRFPSAPCLGDKGAQGLLDDGPVGRADAEEGPGRDIAPGDGKAALPGLVGALAVLAFFGPELVGGSIDEIGAGHGAAFIPMGQNRAGENALPLQELDGGEALALALLDGDGRGRCPGRAAGAGLALEGLLSPVGQVDGDDAHGRGEIGAGGGEAVQAPPDLGVLKFDPDIHYLLLGPAPCIMCAGQRYVHGCPHFPG